MVVLSNLEIRALSSVLRVFDKISCDPFTYSTCSSTASVHFDTIFNLPTYIEIWINLFTLTTDIKK